MEAVSFCPYRAKVNYDWSDVQTTEFKLQQQRFEVQTAKYGKPEPYPTEKDLEPLGECKGSDPLQHQVICECSIQLCQQDLWEVDSVDLVPGIMPNTIYGYEVQLLDNA